MKNFGIFLLLSSMLVSCHPDGPVDPPVDYSEGVYVLNEGNFGTGNGSITWFNRIENKSIEIPFSEINGTTLGDVPNSMTVIGSQGFIVVNNSGKVEVVNLEDFKTDFTILACSSPRYLADVGDGTYLISDWGTNSVMQFINGSAVPFDTIPMGNGPEAITMNGDFAFVANSGGFGIDSTIYVLDTRIGEVVDTILVGKAPMQMVVDFQNKLWVLCRGDYGNFSDPLDDIGGSLHKINMSSFTVEASFQMAQSEHPAKLKVDAAGSTMYYVNGFVYQMNVSSPSLPSTPFVSKFGYGVGADPTSGFIIVSDPLDFTQRGWAFRYHPNGALVDSFRTGVIPGEFIFR